VRAKGLCALCCEFCVAACSERGNGAEIDGRLMDLSRFEGRKPSATSSSSFAVATHPSHSNKAVPNQNVHVHCHCHWCDFPLAVS